MYAKGQFVDILFAQFPTEADRDRAIQKIRDSGHEWNGTRMWAKIDRPLEERLPESFAFSVKKVLVEWGWSRSALYVDRDSAVLYLGTDKVLSSRVSGDKFEVDFGDGWKEYLQAPELDDAFTKAQEKLTKKGPIEGEGEGEGAGERQEQVQGILRDSLGTAPIACK